MFLTFPVQDNKFATVLIVYAPTLQAETGVKETFYRDLHNLLQHVDSKDKFLILGDFHRRQVQTSMLKVQTSVAGQHHYTNFGL